MWTVPWPSEDHLTSSPSFKQPRLLTSLLFNIHLTLLFFFSPLGETNGNYISFILRCTSFPKLPSLINGLSESSCRVCFLSEVCEIRYIYTTLDLVKYNYIQHTSETAAWKALGWKPLQLFGKLCVKLKKQRWCGTDRNWSPGACRSGLVDMATTEYCHVRQELSLEFRCCDFFR